MKIPILFGFITLVFLWYNLAVSISIIKYLKSRGREVSLFNGGFFIKGKIFRYLPLYKEATLRERGKIGSLYYRFYLSFVLAMAFLLLGLISL